MCVWAVNTTIIKMVQFVLQVPPATSPCNAWFTNKGTTKKKKRKKKELCCQAKKDELERRSEIEGVIKPYKLSAAYKTGIDRWNSGKASDTTTAKVVRLGQVGATRLWEVLG